MLPIEICAIASATVGTSIKILRHKLISKAQKHLEIKTIGETKLNTVKNLISKALNDGKISEQEFKLILDQFDQYQCLKSKAHNKQSSLTEAEKKKLIEEGKQQALNAIQKKVNDI